MPMARRLHVGASKVHKWLSLVIGVQLLLWFASGALMSFLPIDKVRGEHLVDRSAVATIPPDMRMADPAAQIERAGAPVETIAWRMRDGSLIAEVTTTHGTVLLDASTGEGLAPIDAGSAKQIARKAWRSKDKPSSKATFVSAESPEYRDVLPAWRIAFSDPDRTSVFVAANTGRITAVRTGTWRLYDFFWSLHIMDWKNHENFNTPWLLAFAIGGLLMGTAGAVLLFMRWPLRRRRRQRASIPSEN
jgi:hypothetical protein